MARSRRAPRPPRDYPWLASDITRSWLSIGVFLPILFGLTFAVARTGFGLSGVIPVDALPYLMFLVAWCGFSLVYMVTSVIAFGRADAETLARWMRAAPRPRTTRDHIWWAINGYGAIWWAVSGGVVSLLCVVLLVSGGSESPPALVWSGITVLAFTWALIAVSFAVHYAREHAVDGGLEFAGDRPRFSDFLYLALQVSTTFASSDVAVTSSRLRKVVSLHGVLAFLFNTVIIAILVAVLIAVTG